MYSGSEDFQNAACASSSLHAEGVRDDDVCSVNFSGPAASEDGERALAGTAGGMRKNRSDTWTMEGATLPRAKMCNTD